MTLLFITIVAAILFSAFIICCVIGAWQLGGWCFHRLFGLVAIAALLASTALGDPPKQKHDNRNYIIRRQEAYQVQGPPTERILSGGRQIDIYRDGSMFEKDHMAGVRR